MPVPVKQSFEAGVQALPQSLRDSVRNWHLQLNESQPDALPMFVTAGGDTVAIAHLVSCSEFAGNVAIRHWSWLCECCASGQLGRPHDAQTMQDCFDALLANALDSDAFKSRIRVIRNQALFSILWRDLVSNCPLNETLVALSDLAENALNAATEFAGSKHRERFGSIPLDGGSMPLVVLAMGKLGGRELNFSSDIDIIFLYAGEGNADGTRSLSAHEYFVRYARQVVSLLEDVTNDGFVYRVDTRLRPFGESGPPVVSFSALESYLLQHGRDWERYAYIKARIVVPPVPDALMTGLLDEVIEPFVYRRYLDYGVFESLREMHARVAAEVTKRGMEGNIKLGPGGIREIEFIVQSLQLVRGGSVSGLKTPELQEAMKNAASARDIGSDVASNLLRAYEFFRRVENCIQAVRDQQVHELPQSALERDRLALAMGYPSWDALSTDLVLHRRFVSEQFDTIAMRRTGESQASYPSAALAGLWGSGADANDWCAAFVQLDIEEPAGVADAVAGFEVLAIKQKIDSIAVDRLRKFIPALLLLLVGRRQPSVTLQRVLKIADKVLRRSAYIALLNENHAALHRLVDLCEKSRYLAEEIGRFPQLLDELLDPRLSRAPDASEMRADLEESVAIAAADDNERQIELVGRFQRATRFRLAVADLSGNIPVMKVSDRLTELAEIILIHLLAIACRDLVARYGKPQYQIGGQMHTAGFGVIAYGKLGGMELSYSSDLDLVFLHDSAGEQQHTRGEKSIANSDFFARLARRLVHFLTAQTGSGSLYNIDTRLRPSGQSGLLVISIEAFERYQDENAWTWEHQALLRSRPVAGSPAIARGFERLRVQTLRKKVHRDTLAADVCAMRKKMRARLDRSNDTQFDLKQGLGGIGDIEFLVQYLVLANAEAHPAVIHYPDNIRQIGTLVATGCLTEREGRQLQEIYRTYRSLLHRLVLDEKSSLVDQGEFGDERKFVGELWMRAFGAAAGERGEVDH